jgi:NADH-ubiquinone oxidoreductase chain 6
MNNLFYSYALDFGYKTFILDIFFFLSIVCSVFVLISKNPVVSVLFLIGLFINVSCYLISIGLEFIGLSYLLVYVGAVSILFLFILMLINIRISELLSESRNSIPLVFIITLSFNSILYNILPSNITFLNDNNYRSFLNKFKDNNYAI